MGGATGDIAGAAMSDTMSDTMDETCEHQWPWPQARPMRVWGWTVDFVSLFWSCVVAALALLSAGVVLTEQPMLLRMWDGWLTIALTLAYIAWYPWLLRVSQTQGAWWGNVAVGWRRGFPLYLALAVGLLITAALAILHSAFLPLVYIDVGAIIMTLSWRGAVLPLAVLAALYIVAGDLVHAGVFGLGYNLFAFALTIGIVASIRALLNERQKREHVIGELRAAQRQLRLASAREVELAALRERNRLAREMHDSLGHALTLIAVKLEVAQRLQAVDLARSAQELEDTKALVRASMGDLRASLEGLRAPALAEQPLRAALAGLARRSDVPVTINITQEADTLARPLQEALYRVAQEALLNVNKHARAQHAWLKLTLHDGLAQLEVADDGVGLAAARTGASGHYGVVGMRERMQALGGALTLAARPVVGALLRATAPTTAPAQETQETSALAPAHETPTLAPAQEEVADARHPHPVG
jgi:signal transduction histidine kinase